MDGTCVAGFKCLKGERLGVEIISDGACWLWMHCGRQNAVERLKEVRDEIPEI